MGIVRIIIIGVLIWFAWSMYRRIMQNKKTVAADADKKQKSNADVKDVKRCAVCGVHILANEAIKRDSRYYCSKAHYDQENS